MNRLTLVAIACAVAGLCALALVWWGQHTRGQVDTAKAEASSARVEAEGAKIEAGAAAGTVRAVERAAATERQISERVGHARQAIAIAFDDDASVEGVVLAWADGIDGLRLEGGHGSRPGADHDSGDGLGALS